MPRQAYTMLANVGASGYICDNILFGNARPRIELGRMPVDIALYNGQAGERTGGAQDGGVLVNSSNTDCGPGWLIFDCVTCNEEEQQPLFDGQIRVRDWFENKITDVVEQALNTNGDKFVVAALLLCNHHHFVCAVNKTGRQKATMEDMAVVDDVDENVLFNSLTVGANDMIKTTKRLSDMGASYQVMAALYVNRCLHDGYKPPAYHVALNRDADCLAAACQTFFLAIPRNWWFFIKEKVEETDSTTLPFMTQLVSTIPSLDNGVRTLSRKNKCNMMTQFRAKSGAYLPASEDCLGKFQADFSAMCEAYSDIRAISPDAKFKFSGWPEIVTVPRTQFLTIKYTLPSALSPRVTPTAPPFFETPIPPRQRVTPTAPPFFETPIPPRQRVTPTAPPLFDTPGAPRQGVSPTAPSDYAALAVPFGMRDTTALTEDESD